jgi:cell division protein FtsL
LILGIVLCAVAISLASPLRSYLRQRATLAESVAEQRELEQQVAELELQQAALADPANLEALAKRRLQYVRPGDTVYVIQAPEGVADASGSGEPANESRAEPWFSSLWNTLSAPPGAAVSPDVLATPTSPAAPPG